MTALVVEGMDQHEVALRGEALRELERLRQGVAVQQYVRLEHARLPDLGIRRRARHDDGDRHAKPATVVRQCLRVVAGRHGDDAAAARSVGQEQQPVQRAALLERRGELLVLELEVDVRSELRRERLGLGERRAYQRVAEPFPGRADVVEGHRHVHSSARSGTLGRVTIAAAKHLLIVYHTQTGHTRALAEAAHAGATDELIDDVETRLVTAKEAGANDLLWANGLLLGTPENFGYMSGGMKDFLDRTFYAVEGKIQPLPYAIFISAGNDGRGALRAIRRIAGGYPFQEVQEPIIARGEVRDADLEACRELGMTLAAGLEAGIF